MKYREFPKQPAVFTDNELVIAGKQVMQRWETPYMKMLADVACTWPERILEIGYGMGISAAFIQEHKPKEHIIVEAHPEVIKRAHTDATLVQGFWQDVLPTLPDASFTGILWDAYSWDTLNEVASHYFFFRQAHRLLKKGGYLTYFCTEHNQIGLSQRNHLKEMGFSHVDFSLCNVNPLNSAYWHHEQIVVPIVRK